MKALATVQFKKGRVLTTEQIAEVYGTTKQKIQQNFNYNKNKYIVGKHYYQLKGEELREFKSKFENFEVAKNVNTFYLWTEHGALLHAKSLGTVQAWETFEELVDTYFRVQETQSQSPRVEGVEDLIIMQAQSVKELRLRVDNQQTQLDSQQNTIETIKETFAQPVPDEIWRRNASNQIRRIAEETGKAYKDVWHEAYDLLEGKGRCNLATRVKRAQERLKKAGASKTQVDGMSKLACIAQDPKLKEIFTNIIKEMTLKYIA